MHSMYRGGHGRGRWGGARARGARSLNPTRSRAEAPPKPLGPAVDTINITTLLIEQEAPKIEDVEYIASYNWLDVKFPVILVPGEFFTRNHGVDSNCSNSSKPCLLNRCVTCSHVSDTGSPPAWTPPTPDPQLKPDSEDVFRDINAARYSSYPLEPAVRALKAMQPEFDLRSVDIVGCGSTMGNLLSFAGSQSKPFRFDVDAIGDTLFFVRKGKSPTELITGLQGYGHTFPEAYTTWDAEVRGSCSHQRIIRYEFGGLHCLVRTETDGYAKHSAGKSLSGVAVPTNQSSLEDILGVVGVTSTPPSRDQELQIRMGGKKISQEQIFDLKTRVSYNPFDMNEILPRLWVNQTPKFLIAYHKFGLFDKPEIKDVRQDVLGWERDNRALLARFHGLLKRIVDVVRDSEKQQCEVYWDGQGPLCITEQVGEGKRALPSDLVQPLEVS